MGGKTGASGEILLFFSTMSSHTFLNSHYTKQWRVRERERERGAGEGGRERPRKGRDLAPWKVQDGEGRLFPYWLHVQEPWKNQEQLHVYDIQCQHVHTHTHQVKSKYKSLLHTVLTEKWKQEINQSMTFFCSLISLQWVQQVRLCSYQTNYMWKHRSWKIRSKLNTTPTMWVWFLLCGCGLYW